MNVRLRFRLLLSREEHNSGPKQRERRAEARDYDSFVLIVTGGSS